MNSIPGTTALPSVKKHFNILDGLRGLAAIAIVLFHFMEIVYTDFTKNFIAHGFLAVDFFFCLSGFVIAYAYDDRIAKMGLGTFLKARLIRLHPLVIMGSVLGLLALLFDPFNSLPEQYKLGRILMLFLSSALMIPYPVMEERFFNLFSLNAPAWSLFWEYMANIAYALVLYKTRRQILTGLVLIAAFALCSIAYREGTLVGGWSGATFWDGFVRISFSFLTGMLIYRSNWIIKNKLGFPGLCALLLLAFLVPYTKWNWLTEPFLVIVYFPLLISLGAGAVLKPGFEKICTFSAQISYPLYMTHYAVMFMFLHYYTLYQPGRNELFLIISIGLVLLLAVAWLVMVFFDTPVRKYLSRATKK